jgi:AcrR family transcriptional regulator
MPRTRSASAHRKVLHATLELVAERGIEGASMDAVARESGVSKATIYKHWPDKDALLLEMMADVTGVHPRPEADSGDTRAGMIAVLSYRPRENAEMRAKIARHFVSYSASNPEFGRAWRDLVMEPPRRELTHLMRLGIEKGELDSKLDIDLSLALLLGPMLYWHLFLRKTSEDPRSLAEGVVDTFWRAFGLSAPKPRRAPAKGSRSLAAS